MMKLNFYCSQRLRWASDDQGIQLGRWGLCLWLAFCCLISSVGAQGTASGIEKGQSPRPQPSVAEIKKLIAGLGSASYLARNNSEEQLLKIGGAAIDQVRQSTTSPDAEISFRSRRLLRELVDRDFKRRVVDLTQAKPGDGRDFGFPGWPKFSHYAGDTTTSRELFGKMLTWKSTSADLNFLDEPSDANSAAFIYTAIPNDDIGLADELFKRIQANASKTTDDAPTDQLQPLSTTARSDKTPAADLIRKLARDEFDRFLPTDSLGEIVEQSPYTDPLKKLIASWLHQQKELNHFASIDLSIIYRYKIEDFSLELMKIVDDPQSPLRGQAAVALAHTSPDQALRSLKSMLVDDRVVGTFLTVEEKRPLKIRLADLAFQLILEIKQQTPADFGFSKTTGHRFFSDAALWGKLDWASDFPDVDQIKPRK